MPNRAKGTIVRIAATLATIVALTAMGCGRSRNPSYSCFEEISPSGWDPTDVIVFEPVPYDTLEPRGMEYDYDLVLRYTTRREIKQLPIAVTVEDENGVQRSDTLLITGKDQSGHDIKRSGIGVSEVTVALLRSHKLTDGESISISPLAPASQSAGLLNIGLVVTRDD